MAKTCYYCGQPATSKEHVPPRCLFPEKKDVGNGDYRKNLFTVPSCDEHNSESSKDDEFFLATLAPIVGNNLIGYFHTNTKLARAIEHTGGHLQELVIENPQDYLGTDSHGNRYPILGGRPNIPRLFSCLEKLARGIYFLEHGQPFDGQCKFLPGFMTYNKNNGDKSDEQKRTGAKLEFSKLAARAMMVNEFADIPKCGDNPAIFTYQYGNVDQFGLTPFLLTFYGNAEIMGCYIPHGVTPPYQSLNDLPNDAKLHIVFDPDTDAERRGGTGEVQT